MQLAIYVITRLTCRDRRLEPLLDLESIGGRRLVAPRPASKLFSSDGLRAQMNAWNDETVKTPNLFSVFFVALETCVNSDWNKERNVLLVIVLRKIRCRIAEMKTTSRGALLFPQ